MKEAILKVLLENTETESIYNGGGVEPVMIVFKNSDNCNQEAFLSQITDEIIEAIKSKN